MDYTGAVGETAVFNVSASGEELAYQWQYLSVGANAWYNSEQTGNRTNALSISIAEDLNGQKYRCIITDVNGNTLTSDEATLTVSTS